MPKRYFRGAKGDTKQGRFDFTCGHVVESAAQAPEGLVKKELPASGKTFRIRHTGSYENLGNAWSAAHQIYLPLR